MKFIAVIGLLMCLAQSKFRKTTSRFRKVKDDDDKKIAGFQVKETEPPVIACNQHIGMDGEILKDHDKLRKSIPAHITMTMWTLNIFAEKDKAETLLRSMDLANVDLGFHDYDHAIQCIKIKAKLEDKKEGFCFANDEQVRQFRMAAWNFQKCREEGTFPGFGLTEMDYLMKAKKEMDKFAKNCTPGSLGCDRKADEWMVKPPHSPARRR